MSLVFDFGQGLRFGLSTGHCRCRWIMATWFVLLALHFFLVPLCWYAVSERQINVAIFCGRFNWSRQTSLSKGFSYHFHDSTTELYFRSTTHWCRCYSVGCLLHSHGKNPVRLYPKLQSHPIGLRKIFIDYIFLQADQSDCTKSVSIFNRFAYNFEISLEVYPNITTNHAII